MDTNLYVTRQAVKKVELALSRMEKKTEWRHLHRKSKLNQVYARAYSQLFYVIRRQDVQWIQENILWLDFDLITKIYPELSEYWHEVQHRVIMKIAAQDTAVVKHHLGERPEKIRVALLIEFFRQKRKTDRQTGRKLLFNQSIYNDGNPETIKLLFDGMNGLSEGPRMEVLKVIFDTENLLFNAIKKGTWAFNALMSGINRLPLDTRVIALQKLISQQSGWWSETTLMLAIRDGPDTLSGLLNVMCALPQDRKAEVLRLFFAQKNSWGEHPLVVTLRKHPALLTPMLGVLEFIPDVEQIIKAFLKHEEKPYLAPFFIDAMAKNPTSLQLIFSAIDELSDEISELEVFLTQTSAMGENLLEMAIKAGPDSMQKLLAVISKLPVTPEDKRSEVLNRLLMQESLDPAVDMKRMFQDNPEMDILTLAQVQGDEAVAVLVDAVDMLLSHASTTNQVEAFKAFKARCQVPPSNPQDDAPSLDFGH